MKKYFRILAPFTHVEDVKLLKNAGVDELYCGYVTSELTKRWPLAFGVLNRRGEGQSFENYGLFKKAVELANKYNLPVYITINGLYTSEQYPLLLDLVKKVESLSGIKGILVADIGFLLALRKKKFKKEIHISTGGTCFNYKTIDFYRKLGVKRVVLPRQLTSDEIVNIVREVKFKTDVEIFIIKEGCGGFIDGYCTFFHCFESDTQKEEGKKNIFVKYSYNTEQASKGCYFYFKQELLNGHFKIFSAKTYKEKENNLRFQTNKYDFTGSAGCRICELYDLKEYPIKSLKIVGRGNNLVYNIKMVKLVSKVVSYLKDDGIFRRDYRRKCKDLFSEVVLNNKIQCTKFHCYFSSHWVKKNV